MYKLYFLLCVLTAWKLGHAGKWSDWRDITLCSAEPCGCAGQNNPCDEAEFGEKVQIRGCERSEDDQTPCQYEKVVDSMIGPIRKTECDSAHLCPTWSDWITDPCECEPYKNTATTRMKRYCKNRSSFERIYCVGENDADIREGVEKKNVDCECAVIKTTPEPITTPEPKPTTTTEMPCCPDDLDDSSESGGGGGGGGILGRRRKRQADDKYGDYGCVECDADGNPIDEDSEEYGGEDYGY